MAGSSITNECIDIAGSAGKTKECIDGATIATECVNGIICVDGESRGVNCTRDSQVRKTKEITSNNNNNKKPVELKNNPAQVKSLVLVAPTEDGDWDDGATSDNTREWLNLRGPEPVPEDSEDFLTVRF